MKHVRSSIILVADLLLISGCATQWQTVSTPTYTNSKQGYTVNLPRGWLKIATNDASMVDLSRNGGPLNLIRITRNKGADAFPATKKVACLSSGELPSDLAADFIADVEAHQNTDIVQVLKNEPTTFGGTEGFHLSLTSTTKDGLRYRSEVYGACSDGEFYTLVYRAPEIYYFDKDLPTFNAVAAAFKINSASTH